MFKILIALTLFTSLGAHALTEETFTSANFKPGVVRHIVLFRYASHVSVAKKNEIKSRFLALKTKSLRNGRPYILSIETGKQNSMEGADQGLEQGFIVSFKSQGDRNFYVGHPIVSEATPVDVAHDDFKKLVGPFLDKNGVVVFDYSL